MGQAEGKLQKKLKPRHISFMAMGGVIGTGIFKGSAETIGLAGPGVVFSYVIAGLLLLVVMASIAEMATVYPNRNMTDFVREAFGEKVSFVMGWMYCFMWLAICVIEIIATGSFLQYWFPAVPLWALSLACAAFIILINLLSVGILGEFEFWLAGIKIAMIIIFIVLGAGLIFGIIPSDHTPYLENFTKSGGFLPNGWTSVFSAMLVVMFSFGGSELIGLTMTETENAERILPKVVGNFILRIILFFTLPILVICGLIPWNEVGLESSPFVQVLSSTGLSGAAHIMNFILVTAVLSAANAGVYGSSRMLFSMAAAGEAPKVLAKTNRKGSPVIALMVVAFILLAGAMLGIFAQDQLFRVLMAVPGFGVILVWICIALSQLKLRRQYPVKPAFKVWGYPYVTSTVILCLSAIAIMFLFDQHNRFSIGICMAALLVLIVWSIVRFRSGERKG
ncbi:amino acid permease [Paenibacillus sp.]|jgi:AAT family amino acid transporter|uniref:amino acid permease n=1 Tax=Paenibacillus sp. TaxID=58172 RepID=UPI0028263E34|nr:amino acid permease [Paenibacillus sp.]MDR0271396.1 amino acid permease [Paenibacillus sp.]